MKHDAYGDVINAEETYKTIAAVLKNGRPMLIGWTDEMGSHYDILFTYKPASSLGQILNGVWIEDVFLSGSFQGGIKPSDLFVSIMRLGCFGFEVENLDTDWHYYSEKLGGRFNEPTGEKLAELINGIKEYLVDVN